MPANAEELVRKKNARYQNNYFSFSFYSSKERKPTRQLESRIFYLQLKVVISYMAVRRLSHKNPSRLRLKAIPHARLKLTIIVGF